MNIPLLIIAVLLLVWIIGTLIAVRGLEEPRYSILEDRAGYEIREYKPFIVAEVEADWDMRAALESGFRDLAGYIFGGNTSKAQVKMTVPVMDAQDASEPIAMTTPVMERQSNTRKHIIAFTMPSKYTLETLPKPDNANIRFRVIEASQKAVLRYTWYATSKRVESKKKMLRDLLARDGYSMKWEIISAQYNPPLSFPLLRRNEVMVDILP